MANRLPRLQPTHWRHHIITSTHTPWTVRVVPATALGISPSKVRVTVPPVGGGFGLKFDCSVEPYAAILAQKLGQAVSLALGREEEMLTCLCRENAEIRLRSAVTANGEIVARDGRVLMDCGAYGGEQVFLTTMTAHTLGGNYRLGAARLTTQAVCTNTPPNGAFRACKGVYNTFALERHTDEICRAISMDPVEFRKRHVVGDGALSATGQVFEGDVLRPMLMRMAAKNAALPLNAAKLVLINGRVEIEDRPGTGAAIQIVIAEHEARYGPVSGTGAFTAPGTPAMPCCAAGHFIDAIDIPVFAVHSCDVAVDRAAGHVHVLDYRVVQDVGRAINPRAIASQVQGGVVQGLGYALHEEVTIGPDGRIEQDGFETYKIPLAGDTLPITLEMYEGAPSIGPLGTKGAGEVPILNVGATIACAVANATGKQVNELPLTPPRVLDLMDAASAPLRLAHLEG
ncbi:xanthine dehydrogenase family protein molybdopterin-binding subunit [Roseovarius arcticus]|uniref:xanthine dehydrogenase family protein molybdopterin-binding subunit n=1 Tax=Roseovarius arcticus TaxID=2547404 RepID=UPI001FE2A1F7|nr:molybdopterin cofactor-binding domain-containing protein [Roseovarius arcticus]